MTAHFFRAVLLDEISHQGILSVGPTSTLRLHFLVFAFSARSRRRRLVLVVEIDDARVVIETRVLHLVRQRVSMHVDE